MKTMVNLIYVVVMILTIACNPVKGNYEEEARYLVESSVQEAEIKGYENPSMNATWVSGPRYYIEESFEYEGDKYEACLIVDVTNIDDITLIYARINDEFQYDIE